MMLSIIHSTIHDVAEYIHLFQDTKDSPFTLELIIIDSNWSEERKEKIQGISHEFEKVTYAPVKQRKEHREYDFLSAHNTGLAYAEGDLCMCLGGKNEFHPAFFYNLAETIEHFGTGVAIRPIELEGNMDDTKWNSYIVYDNRYFIMPAPPLGKNGLRQYLPIITCGFIIMNRIHAWYPLNGIDERYDVGCKWWDNDVLDRLYTLNYQIVIDQRLLIYRHPHIPAQPPEKDRLCKQIYDETKSNLSVYAPNDFDLNILHEEYITKKRMYEL